MGEMNYHDLRQFMEWAEEAGQRLEVIGSQMAGIRFQLERIADALEQKGSD